MLVLTRRTGEEIIIGDNIRVRIVAVTGQRIRIGITAPPAVRVMRSELLTECGPRGDLNGELDPALAPNGTQ
jgi:carbon storage regulator